MFDFIKKKVIEQRVKDEILYEYVIDEMEDGVKIKGLWAKALAYSEGNDSKSKSLYMQYRVQSIKDDLTTLKIAYKEMSRNMLFDCIKNGINLTETNENKINEHIKKELTEKELAFLSEYDCNEKSINVEINNDNIKIRDRNKYHLFNRNTQKFTINNIVIS